MGSFYQFDSYTDEVKRKKIYMTKLCVTKSFEIYIVASVTYSEIRQNFSNNADM